MGRARSAPASSSSLLALGRWFFGLIECLPGQKELRLSGHCVKFRRGNLRPIAISLMISAEKGHEKMSASRSVPVPAPVFSRAHASSFFLRAAERCLGLVAAAAGAGDVVRSAEDGDQDLQNYTDIQDPEEIADQGEQ